MSPRSALLPLALLAACAGSSGGDDTAVTGTGEGTSTDTDSGSDAGSEGPGETGETGETGVPLPAGSHYVLRGGRIVGPGGVVGAPTDVEIRDGDVIAVGEVSDAEVIDVRGTFLVPSFIDSHVHLAYFPVAEEIVDAGIAGAVDLASPERNLLDPVAPLVAVRRAGPMITAPEGYPLQSWGRDGYGTEVSTPDQATAAVDRLIDSGATLIKVPIFEPPALDDSTLEAAIDRAHARGVRVAAHAFEDPAVRRAADLGADLLAHVPTQALSEATLDAWANRAVTPTFDAFGPTNGAIDNIAALRSRGVTVLYGTDLGNIRATTIQALELDYMRSSGMSTGEVLDAATRVPAAYWGMDALGSIEPGKRASLLVLGQDPTADLFALERPVAVLAEGEFR